MLNIHQATALVKLAEKEVERAKGEGQAIEPGVYDVDFSVAISGKLQKALDTVQNPQFKLVEFLKPVILRYAMTLKDPEKWLDGLMSVDGALGATVQLGQDAALKSVPKSLLAIWDRNAEQAKAKFQTVNEKVTRSGNTSVVGEIVLQSVTTAKQAAPKKGRK